MAERKKTEYEISVSTRLPESLVHEVDAWAQREWRDRSKTLAAILTTVLRLIKEQDNFERPLEDVLARFRLDSPLN